MMVAKTHHLLVAKPELGGGLIFFKCFLFSPLPGEMIQFEEYFSDGLKPPTREVLLDEGPMW